VPMRAVFVIYLTIIVTGVAFYALVGIVDGL
jgi:hypothetical protein